MMSPADSRPLSVVTMSSVTWPAGSISQTARGPGASRLTTSATDDAAVAPSLASASRVLADRA
jgi:hypothetical protein